ncbi:MAG: ABC transporter permease [Cellulosilyticum sp.]|nr:ABC transporter permease [Cellulosilyticum sp.]
MNILREYTLDYIKRNKKSSITIMVALLIATIFINSMGLFAYNMWQDEITQVKKIRGNWHGELYGTTWGKDLDYVKSYASVDEVMIKGRWYITEVGDTKRPYLLMRDATAAYWDNMPEQYVILEGRVPSKTGEIAISKQFMENHKEYGVGDEIILPKGKRMCNGIEIDARSRYIEGEIFEAEQQVTYKIVGILDMTTSSMVPAYTGIGYLKEEDILPEDDLTIYIRFKNMRDTYKDLPKIAEGVDYTKDEYGDYLLRYNSSLLSKYLVFPEREGEIQLFDFLTPIMIIFMVGMVIALFVFIIHNAFEVSMNHRKKQLGMFKSIGATPRQIRGAITFEAIVLSIIPIILGLIISCQTWQWFVEAINKVNREFEEELVNCAVSGWVELIVVVAVLLIAWLSAYMPSRKITHQMPIEILKEQEMSNKLKKNKQKKGIISCFKKRRNHTRNIYNELASNQFKAYKKSFNTATISLTVSFLLFMGYLTGEANGNLINDVYYNTELSYNIVLHIEDGNPIDPTLEQMIGSNDQIRKYTNLTGTQGSIWFTGEDESEDFKNVGGFEAVLNQGKYYLVKRDNSYRIRTDLVALDDKTFKAYCQQIGVDVEAYYNEDQIKAIVYNETRDNLHSTRRNEIYIDFLDLEVGNSLTVSEKVYDDDLGERETRIEIGAITNQLPNCEIDIGNCTLTQIMPLSTYQKAISNWEPEKVLRAMKMSVRIQVDEEDIESVSSWLNEACEKIYGTGDYHIWDQVESEKEDAADDAIGMILVIFIAGLFAVIGVSNAFFTVYTSLEQRNRTFAILRSVGISPKGINRLLILEAIHFAIRPIIYASIAELGWMAMLIKIDESNWAEFIPYVPIGLFVLFAILIIFAIGLAYFIGSYKIRKQNIVEAIKDETL